MAATLEATATAALAPGNTFYTAPTLGAGLRGIELDRCYTGDYVAGRRHGFGSYTYPNAFFKYEGQWVNGEKHGLGKLSMRDGAYFEGEFVNGEIQGQGTRRFANGDVYIGTFELGEMQGFGVMRLANGDSYQGPFEHNAFEGVGVYTHANGDVYEGDFVRHKRNGQGRLTCMDGSRYEGGWVDGHRSGEGEASYPDGSWYRGSWERSVHQGDGEWFQAPTGLTYRGAFVEGAPFMRPTTLTMVWVGEEDAKKARAKSVPKAGAAAAVGAAVEAEPVMALPVVLGEPLPMPLTIAAQLLEPLPPPPSSTEPPPDPKAPKAAAKPPPTPPGPVPLTVLNQPPEPGSAWRTADNEWGRQVNLTLHSEPPRPLPAGRLLRALVVNTLLPGGDATAVRLLLSTSVHLEPPLPLARVLGGQLVCSVQLELEAGQRVLEGLVLGAADDWDRLVSATGAGFLVATSGGSSNAMAPGFCRVALPDPKAKKPVAAK